MKINIKKTLFCLFILLYFLVITYAYISQSARAANAEFMLNIESNRYTLLEEFISNDAYIPVIMTVTAYAPLDVNAVEGVCYSGDPRITASGLRSTPGRSVAMGWEFPFGTNIYIPSLGFYGENMDRGAAVKFNNVDVMVATQKEAFEIGRQQRLVFIKIN